VRNCRYARHCRQHVVFTSARNGHEKPTYCCKTCSLVVTSDYSVRMFFGTKVLGSRGGRRCRVMMRRCRDAAILLYSVLKSKVLRARNVEAVK
jgi:hypothetical protein